MLAEVGGDALAGNAADPCADLLDRHHQRPGEQHDPARRIAELGSGLRIGGDAAGVVVGRAGDQPRSENGEEAAPLARFRAARLALRRPARPLPVAPVDGGLLRGLRWRDRAHKNPFNNSRKPSSRSWWTQCPAPSNVTTLAFLKCR